jgi:hypothetical protein
MVVRAMLAPLRRGGVTPAQLLMSSYQLAVPRD